ncbi:MAG: prepilin-type N-terminal cleavage/methylation domain-containing protein [Clostridia bacterium]|nr:prepilin-type N-terminal cleavage/methylation domain-containing protein [Clostridia bacterium]
MQKKLLPKKSKRGVTLVEAVMAVVVLTMFATGVLTLLTTGRTKIAETNAAANAYAAATQKMDAVIATISNGGPYLAEGTDASGNPTFALDLGALKTALGDSSLNLTIYEIDLYDDSLPATKDNVRGWYLKLFHDGATVTGFASNTQGVFDR